MVVIGFYHILGFYNYVHIKEVNQVLTHYNFLNGYNKILRFGTKLYRFYVTYTLLTSVESLWRVPQKFPEAHTKE